MSYDISQVGAGFSDASFGSQSVFRSCLDAIARPGTIVEVEADAEVPPGVHPAAYALLLALLDQDTRLWVAPDFGPNAEDEAIRGFLRFHTGCELVDAPERADFALAQAGRDFPALGQFATGSEDYPDRSATLIVQTDFLRDGPGWSLTGPGIRDHAGLEVGGLDAGFLAQWALNHKLFPRGVDLFIACGHRLAGLPRTTRIEG